ncbi:rapunzel 2 [Kryptolebias marmoratus]|uniref:Rapunzel 2 n=1 Tax=Kryptolebias marmoratus TaxID=37003 RepID=A0A3Q3AC57_KRYMA|nr:rapunzel 2 [Kryptolebias marmoratus]
MDDKQKIKEVAVKVLGYLETATSFAASIDPMFGIVSSVVSAARDTLDDGDGHDPALDKHFKEINTKLKAISEENQKLVNQIRATEVRDNLKKYEDRIELQYDRFIEMIEKVKRDQAHANKYMDDFKDLYERQHSEEALLVYYNNVTGKGNLVFGRPVLEVYMDAFNRKHEPMKQLCLHIGHLFQKGLIALMGYTAVTKDDEEQMQDKWYPRVKEIQEKFSEVLNKCQNKSS